MNFPFSPIWWWCLFSLTFRWKNPVTLLFVLPSWLLHRSYYSLFFFEFCPFWPSCWPWMSHVSFYELFKILFNFCRALFNFSRALLLLYLLIHIYFPALISNSSSYWKASLLSKTRLDFHVLCFTTFFLFFTGLRFGIDLHDYLVGFSNAQEGKGHRRFSYYCLILASSVVNVQ